MLSQSANNLFVIGRPISNNPYLKEIYYAEQSESEQESEESE
jgi:hypothetical protein